MNRLEYRQRRRSSGDIAGSQRAGKPPAVAQRGSREARSHMGNHAVLRSQGIPGLVMTGGEARPYEREAQRVAERAHMTSAGSSRPQDWRLSRQGLDSLTGSLGQALGEGFGRARVHADSRAAAAARSIGAQAFTVGRDIYIGRGAPSPDSPDGARLLAHELTHVAQQERDPALRGEGGGFPVALMSPLGGVEETTGLLGSDVPPPAVTRMDGNILATVYFAQNSFLLDPASFKVLEQLGEHVRFMAEPTVFVDAHASAEGSTEHNQELSERRRFAVNAILSSKAGGLSIQGKAYGESQPVAEETGGTPAEVEQQRRLNRRASILIVTAPAPEPTKKAIDLFPEPEFEPETPEERLNRVLKEEPPEPRKKRSLSDLLKKKLDESVEDVLRKTGVPRKYWEPIKDGARGLAEKGAEKALDSALDQTGLSDAEKRAIKESIRGATQVEAL